jgi:hypothetical protein
MSNAHAGPAGTRPPDRATGSGLAGMSETELATLVAAFDTAIPTDDWPGGWNGRRPGIAE